MKMEKHSNINNLNKLKSKGDLYGALDHHFGNIWSTIRPTLPLFVPNTLHCTSYLLTNAPNIYSPPPFMQGMLVLLLPLTKK